MKLGVKIYSDIIATASVELIYKEYLEFNLKSPYTGIVPFSCSNLFSSKMEGGKEKKKDKFIILCNEKSSKSWENYNLSIYDTLTLQLLEKMIIRGQHIER